MPKGYRADGSPLGGYTGKPGTGRPSKGARTQIALRLPADLVSILDTQAEALRKAGQSDAGRSEAAGALLRLALETPDTPDAAEIKRLRKIAKAAWNACWTFYTANNRADVFSHAALKSALGKEFAAALKAHEKEQE